MSILPKNDIVAGIADPGNTGVARAEKDPTQNNGAPVAGIGDPGSENGSAGTAANGPSRTGVSGYNSKKIYVAGEIHPDLRVPFREISLAPTKTMTGEIEVNQPIRVYDTSGPWGDPSVTLDPIQGLPPLRRDWILKRGDVEEINGRVVQPIDDGYLSETHAAHAQGKRRTPNPPTPEGFGVAGAHLSRRSEAKEERPTSKSEGSNGDTTS